MSATAPVSYSVDAEGVGAIVFDNPGARVNLLNPQTLIALEAVIAAAEGDTTIKALVITSGKERIFVAGADLKLLASYTDEATASEFSRRGQRLLQRIADFRVPVVCAIHGACVGGGFELALACHARIATDAEVTRIGLPEIAIGTIPGWGGTVRLTRLVGVKAALEHLLRAQLAGPAEALEAGFVHEIVPRSELTARVRFAALHQASEYRRTPSILPAPLPPEFFSQQRESVRQKTRGHQPAMFAAIDAIEQGATRSISEALEIEARIFGRVTVGPGCKNLVHVFFLRDAAKKRTLDPWFSSRGAALPPIRRVGVVGAGVMGSGIAHALAIAGFEVVLRDVDDERVARGITVIRGLSEAAVKHRKTSVNDADAALRRIASTTAWAGFETCDLVIEAIVEDVAAKRALFTELAQVTRPDAILASNTSALPIEEIAGDGPNSARTLGIHFFNPVSRMPLVELVIAKASSADTAERALALVKVLGKSPVICRSSPGFLVTRVLFFYLNEAVRLWEQGIATFVIDEEMREFGWPMGPLRLIDEVGIGVTDFIFGELEHYYPERFVRTIATTRMLAAGLSGRKNGASRGFYRYDRGEGVNEAESAPLFPGRTAIAAGRERGHLTHPLMRVMVDEAERCLSEGVVKSADDVDFALLSGAGFPAFRGGLLRWARKQGGATL